MEYNDKHRNIFRLILLIKSELFTSEELKELIEKHNLFFTFTDLIECVKDYQYEMIEKKYLDLVITIIMNSWTPDWSILHNIKEVNDWMPKNPLSIISDYLNSWKFENFEKLITTIVEMGFDELTPELFEKYFEFSESEELTEWICESYLNYVKKNNFENPLSLINNRKNFWKFEKLIMTIVESNLDELTPKLFEQYFKFYGSGEFTEWICESYLNYVKKNNFENPLQLLDNPIKYEKLIMTIVELGLDKLRSPLIEKYLKFTQIFPGHDSFQEWIIKNGDINNYLNYLGEVVSKEFTEWFHPPKGHVQGDKYETDYLLSYQWTTRLVIISKYTNHPSIWKKMFMMIGKIAFNNEKFRESKTFKFCLIELIINWKKHFVAKPSKLSHYKDLHYYLRECNPIIFKNIGLREIVSYNTSFSSFPLIIQNLNNYEIKIFNRKFNEKLQRDLAEKRKISLPLEIIANILTMANSSIFI